MRNFVYEIEYFVRVQSHTEESGLEVEVRACGETCAAAQSDRVANFYYLVGLDENLRQVSVNSLETVGMTHYNIITVTSRLVSGFTHLPGECRPYRIAGLQFQINPFVHAVASPPVIRGLVSRYGDTIVRNVYGESIGY